MKKEYTAPVVGICQLTAFSPLAVTQSIEGDWGTEGGEAGAKSTLFEFAKENDPDDDNADEWDPEGNPFKLRKHQREWY